MVGSWFHSVYLFLISRKAFETIIIFQYKLWIHNLYVLHNFLLCFLLNAETKHSMWKNIFTKSDADLCPFASQGRKWENILFYHSSHLCAHVTFNLLLTRQIFSRPLTQENLGQYPFHSPSSCLQQKITLLFVVDIFRTRVKHLISSLYSTCNIPKHNFGTKYVPKILLFHQLSIFTSKQEKQHHPSVPQFSFTHDHLSTKSGLIKDRLQPAL